ncbi:MAG: hypothetical protein M1823_003730 [Watsoniomyces obsoletus]|nr:MAG: hypothetical protein M1823_003730 [Watsoniomyces obsoletus]
MVELKDIPTEQEFEQTLSHASDSTAIVLNFYATWAAPCTQMRTILSTLASSYSDSSSPLPVTFLNINAEELVDLSERYEVSAVPFLVILKGGQVVESISGSEASMVREAVERHAGKPGASTKATAAPGGATQLPPAQKVEQPPPQEASQTNGSAGKDLSAYAPSSEDPSTAPEMTSKELPESSAATSKEELHNRLSSLVSAAPVMLFMKGTPSVPQCGFSRQLVRILRERGVRYGFFNILADEEVRQGLKEFSDWPTFPQLYVDGELVGGLDIVKEEISNDEEFLKKYAVKPQQGGPGAADAPTQAPTASA